ERRPAGERLRFSETAQRTADRRLTRQECAGALRSGRGRVGQGSRAGVCQYQEGSEAFWRRYRGRLLARPGQEATYEKPGAQPVNRAPSQKVTAAPWLPLLIPTELSGIRGWTRAERDL